MAEPPRPDADTGGSVRLPAACFGVTGLKPTLGMLPTDGMMPLAPSLDCPGFLARSAADCGRLLAVVTGQAAAMDVGGFTVAVPALGPEATATADVRACLASAAETLREAGCRLVATPEALEGRLRDFSCWTRGINLLGLPALALPAGLAGNGLPIGVQLVGPPGSDAELCRLGERFQAASDWHRRRPPPMPGPRGINESHFRN